MGNYNRLLTADHQLPTADYRLIFPSCPLLFYPFYVRVGFWSFQFVSRRKYIVVWLSSKYDIRLIDFGPGPVDSVLSRELRVEVDCLAEFILSRVFRLAYKGACVCEPDSIRFHVNGEPAGGATR